MRSKLQPRAAISNEGRQKAGQEGPVPRREAKGPDPGGDEGACTADEILDHGKPRNRT